MLPVSHGRPNSVSLSELLISCFLLPASSLEASGATPFASAVPIFEQVRTSVDPMQLVPLGRGEQGRDHSSLTLRVVRLDGDDLLAATGDLSLKLTRRSTRCSPESGMGRGSAHRTVVRKCACYDTPGRSEIGRAQCGVGGWCLWAQNSRVRCALRGMRFLVMAPCMHAWVTPQKVQNSNTGQPRRFTPRLIRETDQKTRDCSSDTYRTTCTTELNLRTSTLFGRRRSQLVDRSPKHIQRTLETVTRKHQLQGELEPLPAEQDVRPGILAFKGAPGYLSLRSMRAAAHPATHTPDDVSDST